MSIFIKLIINALAVTFAGYLLPGVEISSFLTALGVALFIAVLDVLVKPLMVLLTLPISILTLGLFYFFINGALILITSALISGFQVNNIWWAILFSILISIIASLMHQILRDEK